MPFPSIFVSRTRVFKTKCNTATRTTTSIWATLEYAFQGSLFKRDLAKCLPSSSSSLHQSRTLVFANKTVETNFAVSISVTLLRIADETPPELPDLSPVAKIFMDNKADSSVMFALFTAPSKPFSHPEG